MTAAGQDRIDSWCVQIRCTRAIAESAQFAETDDLLAGAPVILSRELVEDDPDQWIIEAFYAEKPGINEIAALQALCHGGGSPIVTPVIEQDWVSLSQAGLDPVTAGRFHVRNRDTDPVDPARINFLIPAGRAFGTGQHHTTSGCLTMLDRLAGCGRRFDNIVDIGTGTGLLIFAAHRLWPLARLLATDIDPAAVETTAGNARANAIPLGDGRGSLLLATAPGVDHPLIAGLAPFDLMIANILAGPLIELAPGIAAHCAPGGTLILAGLLDSQRAAVVAAYRQCGFLLIDEALNDQWPTLRMRKRVDIGRRRPRRWSATRHGDAPGFGSW